MFRANTRHFPRQISNTIGTAVSLTFVLPFASVSATGTAQVLRGAMAASNTPNTPNLIVPQTSTITAGKTFDYNAPGFSVSVLTFTAT